jgi:hypothetical protein
MILAAQSPTLSYEAYNTIRQVEHIEETGVPLIKDPLSYGGRIAIQLPLFQYILAFSNLFFPDDIVYIVVPNLIAVLMHAALFYLILELTNSVHLSGIGAAASIFTPGYLSATLLTLSSLCLAIPLLIFMVTLFLKLRKSREKRNALLLSFLLLCLTHPIALLCIPFFLIATVLTTISATKRSRDEIAQQEFALFATFFLLWLYIILYKQSLASVGFETLRANIPQAVRATVYSEVTISSLAVAIGTIPLGLALYAAYKEAAGKHVGIQAIIALAVTVLLAMILQVIPLTTGVALFSIVCIILAAVGLQHLESYHRTLKKSVLPTAVVLVMSILFVVTSILPTFTAGIAATQHTAQENVLKTAQWLAENSPKDSMLLVQPEHGFLYESVAKRKVYVDTNFLGQENAEERYEDAMLIRSRPNAAAAKERHIDYVVSDIELHDRCLNTVYKEHVYVMKVLCT